MNLRRAGWAEAALRTFVEQCVFTKAQQDVEFKTDYMVADLICDLLHLVARRGVNPDLVLDMAQRHFGEERSVADPAG
jgi:hypothetical protein